MTDDDKRGFFDWPKFGRTLEYWRKKNGLRLEDLSNATGVSTTSLSNLEKGRPAILENVLPLCVLMNINPCKLHSHYKTKEPATPVPPPATDLLPPAKTEGIEIGRDGLPSAGSLDDGVPNHFDPSKRGFDPT